MKVIIAGSRGITDFNELVLAIEGSGFKITEVVSGTARGVDRMGEDWATRTSIPISRFPAQWDVYGPSAGHKRNTDMGRYADALIALWDGESRGTDNMIRFMRGLRKPTYVRIVREV